MKSAFALLPRCALTIGLILIGTVIVSCSPGVPTDAVLDGITEPLSSTDDTGDDTGDSDGTPTEPDLLQVSYDVFYTDLMNVWRIELTAYVEQLDPDETVSYEWCFGDGSTADGADVAHETQVVGSYSVSVTATSSSGRQGTRSESLWLPERNLTLFLLEGEHAALKDGGAIVENPDASGDSAVLVPADAPPNLDNEQPYPIKLVSAFELEEPLACRLYARTFGASDQANSFFYRIDGDPAALWEFPPADSFGEHEIGVFSLGKGMHTVTFLHREPGVMLDYVRIEADPDSTPPGAPSPQELASFYLTTGRVGASSTPVPLVSGDSYLVSNQTEFDAAIAAAGPGDEIVFQDGDYTDYEIDFPEDLSGTPDNKIVIRPASPHGVRFRGRTQITLNGNHIHLGGFDFLATQYLALTVCGDYNRITDNYFVACGERSNPGFVLLLQRAADYNEVDHNFFTQTEGICVGLNQPARTSTDPSPKYNYLHHNTLQDIEHIYLNGGDGIMVGTGWAPADSVAGYDDETFTRIEYNKFLRFNGDTEIVSIKSSRVTLRRNAFIDSTEGHVSFRMAFNCIAEENLLLNTAGGIRLTCSGHTVINNLLFLPNATNTIILMDGSITDDGINDYVAATDNLVAHNTIIGGRSAVHFLQGAGQFVAPAANNLITNNAFHLYYAAEGLTVSDLCTYEPLDGYDRNDISNNVIYASAGLLIFPDDGLNDFADPLLEQSGEVFPVLLPGSPCLNQGAPGLADRDFLGTIRPANPDIGAIESP